MLRRNLKGGVVPRGGSCGIHDDCSRAPGPSNPMPRPSSHDPRPLARWGKEEVSPCILGGPNDRINMKVLQTMMSGIPLCWALVPACEILMFMWSVGSPIFDRRCLQETTGRPRCTECPFLHTWTPKYANSIASWAIFRGFGPLVYILIMGFRYPQRILRPGHRQLGVKNFRTTRAGQSSMPDHYVQAPKRCPPPHPKKSQTCNYTDLRCHAGKDESRARQICLPNGH